MSFNKKNFFLFTLFLLFSFLVAEPNESFTNIFNDKLNAEEIKLLLDNKVLIRNIGKASEMCLKYSTKESENLLNKIVTLKPVYLAETIQITPIQENENLISKIELLLEDIDKYVNIPYWSVKQQTWYDLYSSAQILSKKKDSERTNILASFDMLPFDYIKMDIKIQKKEKELIYISTNTDEIKYSGFTCVKPNKMISYLYVFEYNGYWILYCVGGVNAPSFFFLRDRIETTFINRITTFCEYIYKQL